MATIHAGGSFRLESPPDALWGMARMVNELLADDQTIRRWVRERRLPGPCLHRRGRAYWDPADVNFFRRQRLHRIGAEMGEAVGLATPTASGNSQSGIHTEGANNSGS
jgi:hypothetical protein